VTLSSRGADLLNVGAFGRSLCDAVASIATGPVLMRSMFEVVRRESGARAGRVFQGDGSINVAGRAFAELLAGLV
jgi:hypothetical protein